MERRVPPGEPIFPGVTVKVLKMGGYGVELHGEYVGWLHHTNNGQWRGYVSNHNPILPGTCIIIAPMKDAIKAIIERAEQEAETQTLRSD